MDATNMSRKTMDQYDSVERALDFIETRVEDQPGLGRGRGGGRHEPVPVPAGVLPHGRGQPEEISAVLTLQRAKEALAQASSVLDAAYESGLSGPGRLHDLFVSVEAATPGEFKARGDGMTIHHGVAESPFGPCLILSAERGHHRGSPSSSRAKPGRCWTSLARPTARRALSRIRPRPRRCARGSSGRSWAGQRPTPGRCACSCRARRSS
ncbi:MAG: hypothetical protein WDO24_01425 [Pseudomonadota bacterium]